MKTIEESIEIEVPVSTAYNQWTQFESFPQFMNGVERVEQKDDKHLRWVAEIGGETREWDAEITEQHPDHRVAWKALDQDGPNGVVTFHKLDEARTKVMVQMDYEPEGMKETVGSAIGLDSHRVKDDLESFKELHRVSRERDRCLARRRRELATCSAERPLVIGRPLRGYAARAAPPGNVDRADARHSPARWRRRGFEPSCGPRESTYQGAAWVEVAVSASS